MIREVVRITYRELHYRMLRENLNISRNEKKLMDSLKWQGNIKLAVGLQSFAFLMFGFMIGLSIYMAPRELRGVLFAPNLIVPFIYSLYTTSLMVAYLRSGKVLEPLKALPIPKIGFIMSVLILVDVLPGFFLLLPSVLFLGGIVESLLGLGWLLLAILMGHSLALLLQVKFGGSYVGKGSLIKNLARAFGVLLMIGIYLLIQGIVQFVKRNVETLTPIFQEYDVVFPMSASTIYYPFKSLILLLAYAIPFAMLYLYGIRKLWESLEGEKVIGEVSLEYSIKPRALILSFLSKDFKMIFRRTQLLGGFLAPLYIGIWWIYNVAKSGFPLRMTALLMVAIGVFASITLDMSFKIELEGFEVLRSLPITKRKFLLTKGLLMSTLPLFLNLTIFCLAFTYNGLSSLYIAPLVLAPLLTSGIGMKYVGGKIRDVEMPNLTFFDGIVILLLNIIPIVVSAILVFAVSEPLSYIILDSIVIIGSLLIWRW
ncbi:hypothetical protein [Pyrococcus abyssi]|uniref:Uncharacterized protein n=1 Tax=Pyrococcus abyssi (strain GE5 / Orsay) TaxID=272844 RepID=Q9UZY2_PYRAB|nr:hypothetical protein [Pyrococcus abyssi]CAB49924.1 Hypothetical protein, containing aldo/keto reductase family signature [Pyrococcus abyssi GE5]CCE70422.1 TPA: hypothetical protein PAB1697 [Pyrococcus abyssi GE5]